MLSTASKHSANDEHPVTAVNEYEDAERNFKPKSLKFWLIILGVYLSIFLVALDRMIIATAIPRITDEFDSIKDIGWYGSAYMLAAACLIPISGRIYQLYSTKWVFLIAIIIFEAGSALCGAAPSSTTFIIGRAIAGVGSAFIFSGGMVIILPLVPLRRRPIFTSMFGVAFGVSSVLGPIVGGSLTDHVSWRWCFYINLPIGGFTLLAVLLFLNIEAPKREKLPIIAQIKRIDPIGILFFVPSMTCLILALEWGGSTYPWTAPKIIGLLVTFSVLFIAFIVVEILTPDTAMAPTRVVLNRSVAGSMGFIFLLYGSSIALIYYLTLWFQALKGDSPMQAGINTIPLVLSLVIMGILAALVTEKICYYVPAMLLSPILCSVGAGLLSTISPNSSKSARIGYQVLYGLGIGCGMQTSTLVAQNVLPRADVPLGMALQFFMQQLGGAVFIAVSQNIFTSRLVTGLSGIASLNAEAIVNSGAIDLHTIVPANEINTVIHVYNHALDSVFILAAILGACMILCALPVRWKKIPAKKEGNKHVKSDDVETLNVETGTKAEA